MKFAHLSSRYLTDMGTIRTLTELDAIFNELRVKRPSIYTSFRVWMDNIIAAGLIFPI